MEQYLKDSDHRFESLLSIDPFYSWRVFEEEYQQIDDEAFEEWYMLNDGANIEEAVEALMASPKYSSSAEYSIRISDPAALPQDPFAREEFLEFCSKHRITIILKPENSSICFFNVNEDRLYYIKEDVVFAAWDRLTRTKYPAPEK